MPQLSQIGAIYASQLFWLAVVFALIYFGIGKAMVPKIERTIEDRDARIAGDLALAESARAAAASSEAAYQAGIDTARVEALRKTTSAKTAAAAVAETRLKASDAAGEAKIDAAMARIATSRSAALGEIEAATVDAVEQIVAKLSGVVVERAQVEARVKAELVHG